jgi:hypothetical protein
MIAKAVRMLWSSLLVLDALLCWGYSVRVSIEDISLDVTSSSVPFYITEEEVGGEYQPYPETMVVNGVGKCSEAISSNVQTLTNLTFEFDVECITIYDDNHVINVAECGSLSSTSHWYEGW